MKEQYLRLRCLSRLQAAMGYFRILSQLKYMVPLLFLAACSGTPKDDGTSPAPLFPHPTSIAANPEGGYAVNTVTGDSLQPIINSLGDTVLTGVPFTARPKVIHPDSVARPEAVKTPAIERLEKHKAHPNRHKIPENIPAIPVDKSRLKTIPVQLTENQPGGVHDTAHYFINSTGDTIPTGVPIPAKGRVVKAIQPRPTTALSPAVKDAAIANLQYLNVEQGMNASYVYSILEDKRGNLWFGTNGGGVSKYDGESFTHFTEREGLSNNSVWSILEDKRGNLWFGTLGGGVSKYDGESFTHFTEREGLSNNRVLSILEDKSGNLWFGTEGGGVSKYDGESFTHFTEKEGLSSNNVYSILEDKRGNLWFGTNGGGISKYNGKSFIHYTETDGLSNNGVWSILEDRSGNLWVGTWDGGVSKYDGESFTHFTETDGLSNNNVLSILEDRSGNLWFGTFGGGVSTYDGESFTHFTENEGLSSNIVFSIVEDKSGNLWFGTIGGGVSRYNGASFRHFTEKEGLSSISVLSILEDKGGNLWFGTLDSGVSTYDGESFRHFTEKEGLSDNSVRSILEDKSGNLWFGTWDGGVSKYDGESFTHFTEKEGLSNNTVLSMMEDKSGNLWFGTLGGGVSKYDGESFTHFTEKEGLSHDRVLSIMEDNSKNIWVSTERGLTQIVARHEPVEGSKDGISVPSTPIVPPTVRAFGKQDGLKGLHFFANSVLLDSKNRAWWGSINGLGMLDLNTFQLSQNPPAVYLKQLEVNEEFIDYRNISDSKGKNIQFSGLEPFANYPLNLELPYDKNHLAFYLTAIDWSAPHKVHYSHRMLGLDNNWSTPAQQAKVDYRNLSYGNYTFQIKAIGGSGEWSESFEYAFTIRPPWWNSWWAFVVYALLFLHVLYLLRRYELNRFNLKNQLELEKVELESLRNLDQLKSHFFANISHEFRTPLTLIIGQIETLLDSEADRNRKKKLVSVNRNAEQLLAMINQLLDLSKLEAGKMEIYPEEHNLVSFLKNHLYSFEALSESHKITLGFSSSRAEIPVQFDAEKMGTVFINLFSNAIKFTESGGRVDVAVSIPGSDVVEIRVKDSGIGISKDRLPHIFDRFYQADSSNTRKYKGTGIGLSLVRELIALHNGSIEVHSEEGVGSEFIIRLPFEEGGIPTGDDSILTEQVPVETGPTVKKLPDFESLLSEHDEIILIVEDNADVRTFIREQLMDEYIILEAANGSEGIAVSQKTIPDLIITDLMMPEMDGYEFSSKIRSDEKTSHIPIIMLTAKAGLDPKIEGLEAGIDAFLNKPFHVKELLITVKTLIQQRKNLKKQYSSITFFKPSVISKRSADQSFLSKAIDVFENHMHDEHFRVEDYAESLNMSVSQLNRKLNGLVGQPAGNFIRSLRLQRSVELLNQTGKTVAEICYEVGFNDQAYFSRAFKKQFGKSPSAFRKISS